MHTVFYNFVLENIASRQIGFFMFYIYTVTLDYFNYIVM